MRLHRDVSIHVLRRDLQGDYFHIRRVKHCAMNHKAWMQTRAFASELALLFDLISSSERFGNTSRCSVPDNFFIPTQSTNQVSLVLEGKNFLESGRFPGISKAIPPINA